MQQVKYENAAENQSDEKQRTPKRVTGTKEKQFAENSGNSRDFPSRTRRDQTGESDECSADESMDEVEFHESRDLSRVIIRSRLLERLGISGDVSSMDLSDRS